MPKKVSIDNGMVTIPHDHPGFAGLHATQGRALTEDGIVVKHEELTVDQCQQLGIEPVAEGESPTSFEEVAEEAPQPEA